MDGAATGKRPTRHRVRQPLLHYGALKSLRGPSYPRCASGICHSACTRCTDWRQEQYSNYARDHYERYTDVFLEGSPFYDVYGNYITQGWLVYDWTEGLPRRQRQHHHQKSALSFVVQQPARIVEPFRAVLLGPDGGRRHPHNFDPPDVFQAALRRHSVGPYNRQVRPDHAVVASQQHRRNFLQ